MFQEKALEKIKTHILCLIPFVPEILPFMRFIHSFIHLVVCLTTGSKPLPKRALHIVRSRASSFKWEYPLLSLSPSSSFLRLLLRLRITSIPSFIFPSITCCRRQFLRKVCRLWDNVEKCWRGGQTTDEKHSVQNCMYKWSTWWWAHDYRNMLKTQRIELNLIFNWIFLVNIT